MMGLSEVVWFLAILLELEVASACSYYSFGRMYYYSCRSTQYCCGYRECCYYTSTSTSVYSLWYFWFCLILFIIICASASGAYYRKRQRMIHIRTAPAVTMATTVQQSQTMMVSATANSGYAGYQGYPPPPPSYNQAVSYPVGSVAPPNYGGSVTVQHHR